MLSMEESGQHSHGVIVWIWSSKHLYRNSTLRNNWLYEIISQWIWTGNRKKWTNKNTTYIAYIGITLKVPWDSRHQAAICRYKRQDQLFHQWCCFDWILRKRLAIICFLHNVKDLLKKPFLHPTRAPSYRRNILRLNPKHETLNLIYPANWHSHGKITIFPDKHHKNCWFSIAILVDPGV